MPRSSWSKSHKQKVEEYSDSEEEDVQVKERNAKEDVSVRVSKDFSSGEKRLRSGDAKDLSDHGNADVADEQVIWKRRKEKAEGRGCDRWNAGGDERSDGLVMDKEAESFKSKELMGSVDFKSKSSRRHDSTSEKKEFTEKEESKGGSRAVLKRKSEKDSGRKESRKVKGKDRGGANKEKKTQDAKDGEVSRKQGLHSLDLMEERQSKREWPIQDELRNPELEKELEKRVRKRGDGSSDKDKNQDNIRHSDDKRSSRADRSKDVRYKDEKHGDKYQEDGGKSNRHREDKYREGGDKDTYWDAKFRGDKYCEDIGGDNRHRNEKYREDGDRDKYCENGDRDKYCENGDKDTGCREDKYLEHSNKDYRHHRDDKYREDDKDNKHKEEKHREDVDRDSKHRDAKQKSDSERDRDRRARNVKYRDELTLRDHTSESDMKQSRDEINVADLNYKKSCNSDISPIYDDQVFSYKEDKGRRRAIDKEGHSDVRSRSTKEQHSDAEKRSISSCKVDLVTDKGRSSSRNTDVDITLNHIRCRTSPSSTTHDARDHYRVSKPEESKYRDYGFEERAWHNVSSSREFTGDGLTEKMSSSLSMEKSIKKDDNLIGELSGDRRPRSDAHSSPLQMVNKSPSSTSTECRHLNRSDIRCTLDVEEFGQSGGSRDYTGREGKGSRQLPMETHPVDEPSQVDGDLSVSSRVNRNSNFFGNSRSHLPPPFRTGVDSSSVFGTLEGDNRGRSNNHHRRIGDSNMGRPEGNVWKVVPNWPSPVANGFIPFQHCPPPVGFHPVMQQFTAPPIFSVRPTMNMNHSLPYHMPDTDQFSGHGRPLSWRNPVDSCPPLHGWDANNTVFCDDTQVYGRVDWDQNTTRMSNREWDTSGDMWKGKNSGLSADLTSAPQKEDLACLRADEALYGQSVQQPHIEQNHPNLQADNLDGQSSDAHALNNITSEASKNTPEENHEIAKMSMKDDVCHYQVYLSKLDISTDLIQHELYDQFTSLMDMDQNILADKDNSKILYFEEVLEAKVADKILSDSLFAAINDSVFQKAMSLYKKQREEIGAVRHREKVISSNLENLEVVQTYDTEKDASNDDKPGGLSSCCDGQESESAVPNYNEDVDMSSVLQEVEACLATACQKLDEPGVTDILVVSEVEVSMLNVTEMVVDPVPKQEVMNTIVENKSSSLKEVEQSDALLPGYLEEMKQSDSPGGGHSASNEGKKLMENKCVPLLFSDASSGACEAVMPELIESGKKGKDGTSELKEGEIIEEMDVLLKGGAVPGVKKARAVPG